MSFKDFIKKSGSVSDKLKKALEDEKTKDFTDNRFWKPTLDKSGVGGAIIRFLPGSSTDVDALPYIKYWHHSFKNKNEWYIEKSRTTLGEADPVSEYNRKHWDEYSENEQINRKRKLSYVSNILVVKDPLHPENNGKVFLFKYGKKIFDKLMAEVDPPEDVLGLDDNPKEPYLPWDYMNGANLKLKIELNDKKFWNYDNSKFDSQSQIVINPDVDNDENLKLLEEVHNNLYDLQELIAPEQFKSYEDLQKRLNIVLGLAERTSSKSNSTDDEDDEDFSESSRTVMDELEKEYAQQTSRRRSSRVVEENDDDDESEIDEDDELAEFAKLVNDD